LDANAKRYDPRAYGAFKDVWKRFLRNKNFNTIHIGNKFLGHAGKINLELHADVQHPNRSGSELLLNLMSKDMDIQLHGSIQGRDGRKYNQIAFAPIWLKQGQMYQEVMADERQRSLSDLQQPSVVGAICGNRRRSSDRRPMPYRRVVAERREQQPHATEDLRQILEQWATEQQNANQEQLHSPRFWQQSPLRSVGLQATTPLSTPILIEARPSPPETQLTNAMQLAAGALQGQNIWNFGGFPGVALPVGNFPQSVWQETMSAALTGTMLGAMISTLFERLRPNQ
jgi:hypothetical protein